MVEIKKYRFYQKLIALPFVKEIWLFGSRARKDNQDRADIDLAIYCPQANSTDWNRIQDILQETDTLLSIDCIRLDELSDSSEIKKAILKEGIKLYENT